MRARATIAGELAAARARRRAVHGACPLVQNMQTRLPLSISGWVAMLLLLAAGCNSQRRFYNDQVDCADLPRLSSGLADDTSLSETLLSRLTTGTARVALRWDDGENEVFADAYLCAAHHRNDASPVPVPLHCPSPTYAGAPSLAVVLHTRSSFRIAPAPETLGAVYRVVGVL